jgi:hypothetical protein
MQLKLTTQLNCSTSMIASRITEAPLQAAYLELKHHPSRNKYPFHSRKDESVAQSYPPGSHQESLHKSVEAVM